MKIRSRALGAGVAACALLVAAPGAASAAPTISKLRVEADGKALSSGALYVNDSARFATRSSQCGGSGDPQYVRGPSAIGLVQYARQTNRRLRPFFVSDQFDFGLIVCRIGEVGAFSTSQTWLYKVDHREAQVGGDQFRLGRRDEVLWYFADFGTGENTGDELGLRVPARVRPNRAFTATAITYDAEGRQRRAAGARISGGSSPVRTGTDGTARVILSKQGTSTLRARRGNDVPAAPTTICVNRNLDRCPDRRPELIVGTNRAEPIVGTPAPDLIVARRGDDRIDVRGGHADDVRCGPGNDSVRASRVDRVASDCERLNGRRR